MRDPFDCELIRNSSISRYAIKSNEDGGEDVCWFVDAAEAKQALEMTLAAHPEAKDMLRLACSPLGVVFNICKGFPPVEGEEGENEEETGAAYLGGNLKIVGSKDSAGSGAALREQQVAQGMTPSKWNVATFCSDDFQTDNVMPIFFSQSGFAAGWVRSGKTAETVPQNLAVMDLCVLVKQMRDSDVFNWEIFTFVTTPDAYALAQELTEQAKKKQEEEEAAAAGGEDS